MNSNLKKILAGFFVMVFFHLSASGMVYFNGYTRVEAFVVSGFIVLAGFLFSFLSEIKKG